MYLGNLSYLLACITMLNTLIWYFFASSPTTALLLGCCSYSLWFLIFFLLSPHRLNYADKVTIGRWLLFLLAFLLLTYLQEAVWLAITGISLALILDGLDGWLARKLNCQTEFGRIIDMETDHMTSSLLVAASVALVGIGSWFLFINLLRPAYLFFGKNKLSEQEYRSSGQVMRAKLICVLSQVLLLINFAPNIALPIKQSLSFLNLSLLCYSFAIDYILERRHHAKQLSVTSQ